MGFKIINSYLLIILSAVFISCSDNYSPVEPDPEPDPEIPSVIAYASYESGIGQIWIMDEDGTNKEQLTFGEDNLWFPRISPDGMKIIYVNHGDGWIYMMDPDGSNNNRLTMGLESSWSPDGKK